MAIYFAIFINLILNQDFFKIVASFFKSVTYFTL